MLRGWLSLAAPQLLSFFLNLTSRAVDRIERKWRINIQHPDSLLLAHPDFAAHRTKDNIMLAAFQFQRVACDKLQLISHWLRQHDASRLVDCQRGIHNGILPCQLPLIKAYCPHKPAEQAKGRA